MSVCFWTDDPSGLLKKFDARIAQTEQKGKIETWVKHEDGKHYSHTSAQWKNKAFFKPSVAQGKLVFNIVKPQNQNVTKVVYGFYHGHLTETFLNHFDDDFSTAGSTARCATGDRCCDS